MANTAPITHYQGQKKKTKTKKSKPVKKNKKRYVSSLVSETI